MNIFHSTKLGLLVLLLFPASAFGVAVNGTYVDTTDCDLHGTKTFGHELGNIADGFPIDEALAVNVQQSPQLVCVGDDGVPNEWQVDITNLSSFRYKDLFFVADEDIGIGNMDGTMTDASFSPPIPTAAFRIDNLGQNNNLIAGDVNANLIFDPGETWQFLVTNFIRISNPFVNPVPALGSIGLFSASSNFINDRSSASVLAIQLPIPEPATSLLLVIGSLMSLGTRRSILGRPND